MANTTQARKRARQAEARRRHNTSLTSTLRTAIKKVRKAIESGDKAAAEAQYLLAQPIIDRIADKRIIHKNSASRSKSRMVHRIRAMA
jgi:small subunit ribosomal protein S20